MATTITAQFSHQTFPGQDAYRSINWNRAACTDAPPGTYSGGGGGTHAYDTAKQTCGMCPILKECRRYAILHERYGYWGGLTEGDRLDIRAKRGIEVHGGVRNSNNQ